jgi:hypothetical protein
VRPANHFEKTLNSKYFKPFSNITKLTLIKYGCFAITIHAMKRKLIILLFFATFFKPTLAQQLELQTDSINPLIKNDSHGDSINKYFSMTFNGTFSIKDSLLMNSFYSNKLAVNYFHALEKIPELKKYVNTGNKAFAQLYNGYLGKFAIPVFDSSGIIITVNGINEKNAKDYEFRVLENNTKTVLPWTPIKLFCKAFWVTKIAEAGKTDEVAAYLGQFKDKFGNSLTFQVREKNKPGVIKASLTALWVSWQPRVVGVFSFTQLPELLKVFQSQWTVPGYGQNKDWSKDSILLKRKHVFAANENSLIFYLDDIVRSKKIIEYNVVNGSDGSGWQTNDFDFNIVWLKDLAPGNYQLKIRYSIQRQHIDTYAFTIKAAWYQTVWFKISIVLLSCLLIGFVILLFRSRRQSRRIKTQDVQKHLVQTELKSIRSQFNPHFVFNALTSIQGLMTKNDAENASKYLIEFSDLMRDSLKAGNTEFVSVSIEIRILENYLNLEKLRFGFNYQIIVDSLLDVNAIEIPGLLLQPIVENAIKHGISSLQEKGLLMISFRKEGNDLVIRIVDNGHGFQKEEPSNGFGIHLTTERVTLLNQTLNQQKISFSISRKEEKTEAMFHLINWLI